MTRKDYEKAAEIVRAYKNKKEKLVVFEAFRHLFDQQFENFNAGRFESACYPEKES